MAAAGLSCMVTSVRRLLATGIAAVSAVVLAGCGQGAGGVTRTGTITRTTPTLPAATRTEGGGPATTAPATTAPTIPATTTPATTTRTQPATTIATTTPKPATTNHVTVTLTQIQTQTQTKTQAVAPITVATTTTSGVNTTAVVAAGAAAAAASQNEQPEESTPWGWVAFGILAAALAGVGVYWLVRGRHKQPPGADGAPPASETPA
jgi:cobalamin biosynthesis Mg chelatase CobN